MAEPADAVDLKPTDLGHEGSTPSGPTTSKQRWESYQVASELPLALGQKRVFFIDGVGELVGTVHSFDGEGVEMLEDSATDPWWVPLDPKYGMTHLGLLADGEELKKILAEEAANAQNSNSNQA